MNNNAATIDLNNLAKDLNGAAANVDSVVAGLIRNAAYDLQRDAQQRAPIRTGALRSSIQVSFRGPLYAEIGPSVFYGVFQEFGTRGPYEIRPKRPGGVLVFTVNGTRVVTKKVTHPGLDARPYMRPAAQDIAADLTDKTGSAGVQLIINGQADVN